MSQTNEQLATNEVWRLNPLIWGCFLFGISYNINPVWMMGWIVATAPLHELGHGTAAWLASRLAIPTWVFHTAVWPGFSWSVFILVSLVLVAAYFHAHKYRAIFLAWMSGAILLIHLIFLNPFRAFGKWHSYSRWTSRGEPAWRFLYVAAVDLPTCGQE